MRYVGLFLLVLVWVLHELFWSERLYYDPSQDYSFSFGQIEGQEVALETAKDRSVSVAGLSLHADAPTLLLETEVSSTTGGKLVDPYVVINHRQRQYFERGVCGKRYINLSHALRTEGRDSVSLRFHHCRIASASGTVRTFPRPELENRKIMVVAPHADDAEIAAFGLYSAYAGKVFVVTVTAGETEPDYYRTLAGGEHQAGRLKGLLRSWDSIAVPLWGGLKQDQTVQLGYFCSTLEDMARVPESPVSSPSSSIRDCRVFRRFNVTQLRTDTTGVANWRNLVSDLAELIDRFRPDVVVTPHPCYDPHRDHYFSSRAVGEALERAQSPVEHLLLYANHHRHTEEFPFGPSGSIVALPPEFGQVGADEHVFSFELSAESQRKKLLALVMMHDLTVPLSFKKRLRKRLRHLVLGREHCRYGDDDYLRKAVRANEMFFVCDLQQFKKMTRGNESTSR